ncbi:hypothetical protein [Gluconacetobacter entanii]|nr:hypothetical protein [Gluconacetobacter entanii]MCW4581857.1 hypothetical protein [Gluconacetobacter entanii]
MLPRTGSPDRQAEAHSTNGGHAGHGVTWGGTTALLSRAGGTRGT